MQADREVGIVGLSVDLHSCKRALASCQVGRPSKKCSADTATHDCRFDEELEQICFASNNLNLRNTNEPAVPLRNCDGR